MRIPICTGKHHQLPPYSSEYPRQVISINSSLVPHPKSLHPWKTCLKLIRHATSDNYLYKYPFPLSAFQSRIGREDFYRQNQLMSGTADGEGTNGVILWRHPIHVLPVTWRQLILKIGQCKMSDGMYSNGRYLQVPDGTWDFLSEQLMQTSYDYSS